ncbi:MAG TPA: IPT/TIG domain-containing protein [Leptospiraceae bacterium]|nr:IPT/TIG domain-containing protein [Leptospiraceae bacterium]HRG76137.1 IPT/TIG domain-containing protein [Leptospiraceae bacterium]
MNIRFLFLTFLISVSPMLAQDVERNVSCEKVESNFFIKEFYVKDFSRNLFHIAIKSKNRELLPGLIEFKTDKDKTDYDRTKEKGDPRATSIEKVKFVTKIGSREAGRITGSYHHKKESSVISYELISAENDKSGPICISLYDDKSQLLANFPYTIPDRNENAGEQPLITEITPNAGVIGETITVRGRNFQDNLDNIYIYIIDEDQDPNYEYGDKEKYTILPFYLSQKNEKGIQELKFTIPSYDLKSEYDGYKFNQKIFGKKMSIKLMANYRPSTTENLVLLKSYWKWIAGSFSIFVTGAFLLSIAFVLKKVNFTHEILLDAKTNSYSLSNFQSFAWTIVFIGSYFYVAISSGIILDKSELPDFNFSLIGLMGISYGGLLTSSYLDRKKKDTGTVKHKPELKDLISDPDGGISLSRLQLLGFTLISIIVYIFYLFKANVLNGLPGIPETLHTMLLTSQGGYLGSKAITGEDKKEDKKETAEPVKANEDKPVEEKKEV